MTRWHKASCASPDVVVSDHGDPKCQSCGMVCPPIEELMKQQSSTDSGVKLPSDEPRGQRNLRWPSSVTYSGTPGYRSLTSDKAVRPELQDAACSSSLLYGETMKGNEFRLACLPAVANPNAPVHVGLEVYADEDHPEYECTSYTWGGEDNNTSLCCPIYVGPYWDVLLQTKNCYSMLQHIRPWRGMRMVWIDAICINQMNLIERAAQVAKMRQIYENCTRVIIYLGPDCTRSTRRFPIRQSLDSVQLRHQPLETSEGRQLEMDFSKMLSRRYFSRVWVSDRVQFESEKLVEQALGCTGVDTQPPSYHSHWRL